MSFVGNRKLISLTCICTLGVSLAFADDLSVVNKPVGDKSKVSSLPGPIYDDSNPNYLPYFVSNDPKLRIFPPLKKGQKTKLYILPATPQTTKWGVFDSNVKPVMTINSGDSVSVETISPMENQLLPGVPVEEVEKLSAEVENRGPHTLTGPIYVNGAEPGDVLAIHLDKILLKPQASNNTMPGKGLFPEHFPKAMVKYFYLDIYHNQMDFGPGIRVPLHPFPGIIAVNRPQQGVFDSIPPGDFGGNLDLREMTEGTTLYLPVFVKGGMIWTGDSHAGQGNGEIDLTAIEGSFTEERITVSVLKNKGLKHPIVETPTSWITVGYDTDLNKALDLAKVEAVRFIMGQYKLDEKQATAMMYKTWNCPIAEVVNGVKGVYFILPKNANAPKAKPLPSSDTATQFVTVGKNADVLQAMKDASWAMMTKNLVGKKKMTLEDAYVLASIAMDCRISPYVSGDKEVHCMVDKSLWVNTDKY